MSEVKAIVLRAAGINCDMETEHALELAGAKAQRVHINRLIEDRKLLRKFQILVFPGGFSYGDDVAAGKILANQIVHHLSEPLREFIKAGKLVLGICNGFQVLVRTGLLPDSKMGDIRCTLMGNDSGRFECRWINIRVEESPCIFTRGLSGSNLSVQVAHGEGKFYAEPVQLEKLESGGRVVFRYSTDNGGQALSYPENPNGSLNSIAGICDSTGLVLGLMPHPERFVSLQQHPNWRRGQIDFPHGLPIFKNAVDYCLAM